MRGMALGRFVFALALIQLGVVTFYYRDFALSWQPVPEWVPLREALVLASAAILVGGGASLLFPRTAPIGALVVTSYMFVFWALPHLDRIIDNPARVARWLGLCESLAGMVGAWVLAACLPGAKGGPEARRLLRWVRSAQSRRLAQGVFGVACLVCGVSHFVYADFTAQMIPAWLPAHEALAYVTGACHVAAGLALVSGVLARLAAALEAAMLATFVLLVHVPSVFATPPLEWAPDARHQWTPLLWAAALTGACLCVVASCASRNRQAHRPLDERLAPTT